MCWCNYIIVVVDIKTNIFLRKINKEKNSLKPIHKIRAGMEISIHEHIVF
jgi:hypothetical protein